MRRLASLFVILVAALFAVGVRAAVPQGAVETTWRLIDYLAVDYAGAVKDGRVISASEYAEMREFSATVTTNLHSLGHSSAKASLEAQGQTLQKAIDAKADPDRVAEIAHKLEADLLRAYPIPLAPQKAPDIARGWALYQENCASCHGQTGQGNGPDAAKLNPPPVNFTDRGRASQRSIFGLYQVITQGIAGTKMKSFRDLPEQDRWALAFRVGAFAYPSALTAQGKLLWQADPALRRKIPDLKALVAVTPQALAKDIGEDSAVAVIAYLRSAPEAAFKHDSAASLALTRARLAQSVAAYRAGNADEAKRLALSAYLDGFEPIEPILASRDAALMHDIESGMGNLRSAISGGAPVDEVVQQAADLDALFTQADAQLGAGAEGGVSTFLSALTIVLREGIEALLIVVAMVAFLRKADRPDALKYVHWGWAAALTAGGLTWFVATRMISVSGASRELTEGFGGILAAFVLVFVGIWMHGKANADAWQRYVREKMDKALSQGSGWFLFGLAFVVVYRELFETILFFAAMWEDSATALLSGVIAGALALAVIAFVMLRYSARLPITQFFRYSSLLMAVLAVVLAGKGIGAVQEAGLVGVTPLHGLPRIDIIGFQPNLQVVLAQAVALLALVIGFYVTTRRPASTP